MRHPLITICDLQPLTDAELERLEASLRHILETAIDLTEIGRDNIIASLVSMKVEADARLARAGLNHYR